MIVEGQWRTFRTGVQIPSGPYEKAPIRVLFHMDGREAMQIQPAAERLPAAKLGHASRALAVRTLLMVFGKIILTHTGAFSYGLYAI